MSDTTAPPPRGSDRPAAPADRGAALFAARRFEEAVEAYTAALRKRKNDPSLLTARGRARYENDEHEEAADDLRRSLALRPGHPEALTFLAAALHEQDEDDEAFPLLAAALEADPTYAPAYFFRGRIVAKFDDVESALADYTRAIELDPAYPFPYSYRADAWDDLDEAERATADRQTYLELHPTADAYHDQAHAWDGVDDEKALACYAHAVRLEPDEPRHLECRASLLEELCEFDRADADHDAIDLITQAQEEEDDMTPALEHKMRVWTRIQEHFGAVPLEEVQVVSRKFPVRVGADLQLALDRIADGGFDVVQFWTLHVCGQPPYEFTQLYTRDRGNPPTPVPPEYVEIDVGEDEPVPCLKFGVWLLTAGKAKVLVMLDTQRHHGEVYFQVAAPSGKAGKAAATRFFTHLEDALKTASCYRGKVLSLEYQDSYSGQQCGILVHKIRPVRREEVILPPATLGLLERNVIQFVKQREKLRALGLSTKKGLLFYGPPGTGKTHTIHYLTRCVEGQTTLLVTAEQVGMLGEYMTLARLFQPCLVVIEDVDLIARDRAHMHTPGEEVLLNKLLNEMDGLKPNTDILFVLTTNRPEKLEAALASRPGRIDQAIEFPLPDEDGRAKLVRLYTRGMKVPAAVAAAVVKKTDKMSASFIKELMRRATQFYLERDGTGPLDLQDVENALEEMLFAGGSLNRVLLGAAGVDAG